MCVDLIDSDSPEPRIAYPAANDFLHVAATSRHGGCLAADHDRSAVSHSLHAEVYISPRLGMFLPFASDAPCFQKGLLPQLR